MLSGVARSGGSLVPWGAHQDAGGARFTRCAAPRPQEDSVSAGRDIPSCGRRQAEEMQLPWARPFREQALKESRRRTTSRPRPERPDPEGAGGRAAGCPPRWYVPQRPAAHTRTSRSPGVHELQKQGACHRPRIVDRGAW